MQLLAYCGLALVGPQGFVLCLGQDGHIEVETALTGTSCGVALSSASQENERTSRGAGLQVPGDHCGPCNDTALALDTFRLEPKHDLTDLAGNLIFMAAPGFYRTLHAFYTEGYSLSGRDAIASFPLFLRTTILLI